jgi:hypothetical protein
MIFPYGWCTMNNDQESPVSQLSQIFRTGKWIALLVSFTATTLLGGIGLAALLGRSGAESTWNRWSAVGQTFGALSTLVSGFALAAFLFAFISQKREFGNQRAEQALQRETIAQSQTELYRNTAIGLRKLHLDLINLAMNDQYLASVWPSIQPDLAPEVNRQYLYANLIFQHHWLCMHMSDYTEEQLYNGLRYLFTSRLMRQYWRASAEARVYLVEASDELLFSHLADAICGEYETNFAVSQAGDGVTSRPPSAKSVNTHQISTEHSGS